MRYDRDRSSALPWLYGIASPADKHHRHRASELRALERVLDRGDPHDLADAVTASVDARVELRAMAKLLEELPTIERDALPRRVHRDGAVAAQPRAAAVAPPPTRSTASAPSVPTAWRRRAHVGARSREGEKERLMHAIDEGKTKVVIDAGDGTVLIRSKDDITAGDGEKHDVIDGKRRRRPRRTATSSSCSAIRACRCTSSSRSTPSRSGHDGWR